MYIHREAEPTLRSLLGQFKVVLVTGPRQVGKTTLIRTCLADEYGYVTLDDPVALSQAREDPALFFQDHPLPLVIDEVQYAPGLFGYVKYLVDQQDKQGQVVLTGSQTYHLMQGVSESLAGRVALLELPGLSMRELLGTAGRGPYVPGVTVPAAPAESTAATGGMPDIWELAWRGSMPRLQQPDVDWDTYYANYERTYLERDVRALINVRDSSAFYRFLVAAAARTGQLLNMSDLANDVDIDAKTVKSWLSVLQASGIVRLVQPWFSNVTKRLSKTPKLHFMDTGLACHLLGWTSPEVLARGAMAGNIFETFVVGEVLKSFLNAGRDGQAVFFYRDASKREVDLLIRDGRTLHPVEIKAGASPRREAIASFAALDALGDVEVGAGAVLCRAERPYSLSESVKAVPVWEI